MDELNINKCQYRIFEQYREFYMIPLSQKEAMRFTYSKTFLNLITSKILEDNSYIKMIIEDLKQHCIYHYLLIHR